MELLLAHAQLLHEAAPVAILVALGKGAGTEHVSVDLRVRNETLWSDPTWEITSH